MAKYKHNDKCAVCQEKAYTVSHLVAADEWSHWVVKRVGLCEKHHRSAEYGVDYFRSWEAADTEARRRKHGLVR